MKRFSIFLFIAIFIAGSVFAQERGSRQRENNSGNRIVNNPVKIDGVLKLEKGFVAVESGDSVHLVPLLNRYIGFIDGLKEGKNISVEGYTFRNSIHPVKVTIDGKTYEFNNVANHRESGSRDFGSRDRPGRGDFNMHRNFNHAPRHKNAPGHRSTPRNAPRQRNFPDRCTCCY